MKKSKKIEVLGADIALAVINEQDYISLTDIVKTFEGGKSLIGNWISSKNTIEFLGIWEQLNNSNFKLLEFEEFKNNAGTNRFSLSPQKWIEKTNATGITSKSGKYGGTYAHKDIAFEFGSWLSPTFKLLLIKEFQRLKLKEQEGAEWDYRRFLAKLNYRLHTEAIKENLIPLQNLPKNQEWLIYAEEADILNVALFGKTAKDWREKNTQAVLKGENIRDHATIEQLTVLTNLENLNSSYIDEGLKKEERFLKLRTVAERQIKTLLETKTVIPKKLNP